MTEPTPAADALPIWREKLAGVTPLVEEARWWAEGLRMPGGRLRKAEMQSTAKLLDRLADAFARSDRLSRILANQATVEGLARAMARARWPYAEIKEKDSWEEHEWPTYVEAARACLNHLAQLALGDGT